VDGRHSTKHLEHGEIDEHEMGAPIWLLARGLNASASKQGCEKMTLIMTKPAYQRGQSIIEITLLTPLLLMALYIPADFGIGFYMGNLTQNAAREGARIGSGLQKSVAKNNDPLTFGSSQANTVKDAVFNRLPGSLTNKSVTVTFYDGTACMAFIEVTAQGDYNFFLYKLMGLFGSAVPNSVTISRTTQIRHNYQPYTNIAYCTTPTTYGPYSS
jgi:Flp pilus assembly protein TadG